MVASVLKKLDLNEKSIEKDLPDYIKSGLMMLYKRQHDDNGWGWYEFDETDPYMTAYVLYGLLEAKRLLPETGIPITVDEGVIKRGTASLITQLPTISRRIRSGSTPSTSFRTPTSSSSRGSTRCSRSGTS